MLKSICKIYLTLLFTLFSVLPAQASEYIENFDSRITVNPDASLSIEETLIVHHEGIRIRRGITKVLLNNKGERYKVHQVLRNGKEEPWFIQHRDDMQILNTGDDTFLPSPGISVYTIRYTMYDALRRVFNKPYNELYLNLTSHGSLPIKRISVNITYPKGTDILSQYGYLNQSTKQQYTPGAAFEFYDIAPGDNATVAQIFSRGTVAVGIPGIWRFLLYSLLATLIYYILAWFFVGRDPEPRAIVPDWEIPQGVSALDAAYIINNGKAPKNSFFIHILWLVNQKAATIREIQKGQFKKAKGFEIKPTPDADKKNPEIKMFTSEFPQGTTIYDNEPDAEIAYYSEKLKKKTAKKLEKTYYHKRTFYTFLGALIIPITLMSIYPQYSTFVLISSIILLAAIHTRNIASSLIIALNLLPYLVCCGIGFSRYLTILIPYIALVLIFKYLLFQPSVIGQRSKEKIAGLKMFLKTINGSNIRQKNIIRSNNDIDMSMEKRVTPEDMEALFPYAVALGLEKAWVQKYQTIFTKEDWQNFVSTNSYYSENFTHRLDRISRTAARSPVTQSRGSSPFSSGHGGFGGGFGGGGFGGGGFGGR